MKTKLVQHVPAINLSSWHLTLDTWQMTLLDTWHFTYATFEHRHENKSCSLCPKDQHKYLEHLTHATHLTHLTQVPSTCLTFRHFLFTNGFMYCFRQEISCLFKFYTIFLKQIRAFFAWCHMNFLVLFQICGFEYFFALKAFKGNGVMNKTFVPFQFHFAWKLFSFA